MTRTTLLFRRKATKRILAYNNIILSIAVVVFLHQSSIFVSSFSPPQRHQTIVVSTPLGNPTPTEQRANTSTPVSFGYRVVDRCPIQSLDAPETKESSSSSSSEAPIDILAVLQRWNPNGVFPSRSQAKRSLQLGKVLLFNDTTTKNPPFAKDCNGTASSSSEVRPTMRSGEDATACIQSLQQDRENTLWISLEHLQPHIARPSSVLDRSSTVLVLVEPIPSVHRHDVSVTKYMFPPSTASTVLDIVYEDDHIAVVNKPENTTTIGRCKERDGSLQSVLPFFLRASPLDPTYCPRPIHRLDRRTSGLVLVAKTQTSMRDLSGAFAKRMVRKTYSALVFETNTNNDNNDDDNCLSTSDWATIDYPIENRESISEVRRVTVTPIRLPPRSLRAKGSLLDDASSNGNDDNDFERFSLVEVRPKTGRTHQIRRHLSYCLGMPIVGDSKYDGGARHLRTNGMYLCCHDLRFPYPYPTKTAHATKNHHLPSDNCHPHAPTVQWIDGDLNINVALPDKFTRWIQLEHM